MRTRCLRRKILVLRFRRQVGRGQRREQAETKKIVAWTWGQFKGKTHHFQIILLGLTAKVFHYFIENWLIALIALIRSEIRPIANDLFQCNVHFIRVRVLGQAGNVLWFNGALAVDEKCVHIREHFLDHPKIGFNTLLRGVQVVQVLIQKLLLALRQR